MIIIRSKHFYISNADWANERWTLICPDPYYMTRPVKCHALLGSDATWTWNNARCSHAVRVVWITARLRVIRNCSILPNVQHLQNWALLHKLCMRIYVRLIYNNGTRQLNALEEKQKRTYLDSLLLKRMYARVCSCKSVSRTLYASTCD